MSVGKDPRPGDRMDFEDVPEDLQPRRRFLPSLWSVGVILALTLIGAAIAVFVRGGWQLILGGHQ